jgi:hypothetical protein
MWSGKQGKEYYEGGCGRWCEGLGTGMIMGRWGQRRRGGRGTEGEVKDSKGAFKGTLSDSVRGDGGLGRLGDWKKCKGYSNRKNKNNSLGGLTVNGNR